jgi:hypothetical protein
LTAIVDPTREIIQEMKNQLFICSCVLEYAQERIGIEHSRIHEWKMIGKATDQIWELVNGLETCQSSCRNSESPASADSRRPHVLSAFIVAEGGRT